MKYFDISIEEAKVALTLPTPFVQDCSSNDSIGTRSISWRLSMRCKNSVLDFRINQPIMAVSSPTQTNQLAFGKVNQLLSISVLGLFFCMVLLLIYFLIPAVASSNTMINKLP